VERPSEWTNTRPPTRWRDPSPIVCRSAGDSSMSKLVGQEDDDPDLAYTSLGYRLMAAATRSYQCVRTASAGFVVMVLSIVLAFS
jgi:hypothetical protein